MKKCEVVLINSPAWGVSLPPLGIAYIAADLEHRGICCEVLDLNIQLYSNADPNTKKLWGMDNYHIWSREDHFKSVWDLFSPEMDRLADKMLARGLRVFGFSLTGANILFSVALATLIRKRRKDICIVFGGPSCAFLHDNVRMPFRFLVSVITGEPIVENGVVDYIVMGEGEGAFAEIISASLTGRVVHVPGVVKASFPSETVTSRSACIDNLDALSFPAWDKFHLDKYIDQEELPILFSRGCVNRCAFCNDWGMRNGAFRYRSAANIVEEMRYMQRRFRKNTFRCHDLLFNGNLPVLADLADRIIGSGLKVNWTAQGVIRKDMELELFRKLRSAGLITIVYGVESFSDKVLIDMGKRFTFEDVRLVLERTKKAGINTWINLISGFPTETEEDFEETKQRVREIRENIDVVSSLNPCHITASTELERSPERFSISYRDGEDRCDHWESQGGLNNHAVRVRRVRELVQFFNSLGIRTHFVGIGLD